MPARPEPAWASAGRCLTALIVAQALSLSPAIPQQPAPPAFEQEHAKQESIYRSRGASIPGGYVHTRGLASYTELLPSGFDAALRKLSPRDRWLDIGAGTGQAILDYHAPEFAGDRDAGRVRAKARAVAISIEDRRTDRWHERAANLGRDRIQYLFGKRLRDYPDGELGRFRLITDVYGGFSYTDELSAFVAKVLALLERNGSFYTMVQSVRLEDGKDRRSTWYLTEIVDPAGKDVTVCSWLKRITCASVTCESKSTWETPTELIHIRKVCNAVSVPALARLQYEAGTPPGRRFQLRQ